MADTTDSKSVPRKGVWVQIPPRARRDQHQRGRLIRATVSVVTAWSRGNDIGQAVRSSSERAWRKAIASGVKASSDERERVGVPGCWYSEKVARGAFADTLSRRPDGQRLINHEGLPIARTIGGTLRLAEDDQRLRVDASQNANDPEGSADWGDPLPTARRTILERGCHRPPRMKGSRDRAP
jgi:Caudovirus prohead serine protease